MATQKKALTWGVPIVVVLIAVALIAYILGQQASDGADAQEPVNTVEPAQGPTPPSSVQQPATPDYATLERLDPQDPLAMGAVDAPAVLVGFSDYQCQFCARWSGETLPELQPYVDAGQLRIEWYDISLFGDDSHRAALAAYAAGQQGKFWEYHERLFVGGDILSPAELSEDALTAIASEVGLDVDQFTADVSSAEVSQAVDANMTTALEFGVFSTPSFTVNGEPIVGAQPAPVFIDAVESAIAAE